MTTTQDIRTLALQAHAVQQEAEAQQKRIEGERAAEEKRQQDATLAAKVRAFASVRLGLELPDTQEYPVPLPGIGYLTYATDQFRSPYLNLEPRCAEPGCAQTYRNQVLTLADLGRRAEQFPPDWKCYLHDGQHTEDGDPIEVTVVDTYAQRLLTAVYALGEVHRTLRLLCDEYNERA